MSIEQRQVVVAVPLECPRGHKWESEVMPGINWSGPAFKRRQCPFCGLHGQRQALKADELGGLITEEQLQAAGVDAHGTLGYILIGAFGQNEHEVTVPVRVLAASVVDSPQRVMGYIKKLESLELIKVEEQGTADADADRVLKFSLGAKLSLIKLAGANDA